MFSSQLPLERILAMPDDILKEDSGIEVVHVDQATTVYIVPDSLVKVPQPKALAPE